MDSNFPRLLALLEAIPRTGKRSTSELATRLEARGFEVYPRMVQRDLQRLAQHFPIEVDERSKPYGWRWRPNSKLPGLPEMTPSQALSFYMLDTHIGHLLPRQVGEDLRPYIDQAKRLLNERAQRTPIGQWPARVRVQPAGMPLLPPIIPPNVHAAVTEALLLGRQLEVTQKAKGAADKKLHRIHPLALIQEGNLLYLAARYYDYEDVRLVAVHRITKALMLDANVSAPSGFNLERWIESGVMGFGGSNELIRLRLRFSEAAGRHLLESPLSKEQQVKREGEHLLITAQVRDTEKLQWWLLGFAENVEVLSPKSLRQNIAKRLQTAAARYQS